MAIYYKITNEGTQYVPKYICTYREGYASGYTLWDHNQFKSEYSYLHYTLTLTDGKFVCPEDCTRMFMRASSDYSTATNIVNWQYIDTSNVTNMNEMFTYADLRYVNLSLMNTSNVTSMRSMFYAANDQPTSNWSAEMNLTSWDVSKVVDMAYMFYGLGNPTKLDLTGWDISNVTNMGSMFHNCHISGPVLAGDNISWERMCNASSASMFVNASCIKDGIDINLGTTGDLTINRATTRPTDYFYGTWIGFWDKYVPYFNSEGWQDIESIYFKIYNLWLRYEIYRREK